MIPRKAHFIYGEHNVSPMPEKGMVNMGRFTELNRGWESRLLTIDETNPEHADIFEWNKLAWSQVVRYETVLQHGGLYSDVDIEFYGPVPSMEDCDLMVACETHGGVSDAFYAARPGHPILEECFSGSVQWCRKLMDSGKDGFTTREMFNGCGVTFFSKTIKKHTGLKFFYDKQIHMTNRDFGGRFHPENGVGILPFEALCRHNTANWVGWHQCWGSWRPATESGEVDMTLEACITTNLNTSRTIGSD